jgi:hypothetical protein
MEVIGRPETSEDYLTIQDGNDRFHETSGHYLTLQDANDRFYRNVGRLVGPSRWG